MKKLLMVCIGLILASCAFAQTELKSLMPVYWVSGTVADSAEATVNNRRIFFYRDAPALVEGKYAESNCFSAANSFMLNAFAIFPGLLTVGETYQVATEQDAKGYGATGTVKISGLGWDEVKGMALAAGGGIVAPVVGAPGLPPKIKLWFGSHVYQPGLVAKGQPFVVPADTDVRTDISIDAPYSLAKNISDYSIVVDPDKTPIKLSLTASNVSAQTYAAGSDPSDGKISSMSIKYSFAVSPLKEGPHSFVVTAPSSSIPPSIKTYTATVEVMGGPLRLIGQPLTYPSPFRIAKDKLVYIQYTLSRSANVDLYLVGVGGTRIKKFVCNAGTEGGSAGINKVSWTGQSDLGSLAGNAIYVGSIISRDDGRMLGRFKLTIVD